MKKTINIEYRGLELDVIGDYEPMERGVMYNSDMGGNPDYPSTFDIIKVLSEDGINIINDYDEDDLESIVELCLNHLE